MNDPGPDSAAESFGDMARRVTTPARWGDLVLDPGTQAQIEEVRRWLDHRPASAAGRRVLFHGPPGTGKTLAAGLLGKVSGREVYRVDLSGIASKYIGETEKNLARLFETARHRDWILFFDEADALFGKRSEVKDSHDRYANLEVSYLLQRLESFDGLVVVATNLAGSLDRAALARFDVVVRFPLPAEAERRRIWQGALPREPAPADPDAFTAALARYELSGRSIVGALRHAALTALESGSPVLRYADAAIAVRRELERESRAFSDLIAAECAAESDDKKSAD
ncbi:MAG: ATP-binding protein [Kiloniellaceae bacterium]